MVQLLHRSTSLSDKPSYLDICESASTNDEAFATFKRDEGYREILEHVSEQQGANYLAIIRSEYPHLLTYLEKFKTNDRIGDPIRFSYPDVGLISPTTLRYIKVLGDLEKLFGLLSDYSLAEIGGGYGGQCKIIHNYRGFRAYQIHDLPAPLALATRYLDSHGVTLSRISNPDLVISNYAFSECKKRVQRKYLNDVICQSPRGYMICNFIGPGSYSLSKLLHIIPNARTLDETPLIHPNNVVIVWD